jgi:hypothetical protein
VPEKYTARPRFEPTLGPETARAGGAPLKNGGAAVLMPYFIEVTGYELT